MVGNLCGPVVIPTAKPRLSLYCCLCLIISEDGLLTSPFTPKLIPATRTHPLFTPDTHPQTSCARTHTFPETQFHVLGGRALGEWALQGAEMQPARTGSFLLLWVWARESRSGWGRGGGPSPAAATLGAGLWWWLEVMGEGRRYPTQLSPEASAKGAEWPRAPAAHPRQVGGWREGCGQSS